MAWDRSAQSSIEMPEINGLRAPLSPRRAPPSPARWRRVLWPSIVVICLVFGQRAAAEMMHAAGDWEMVRDEDGIRIYRSEVPGSSLFAFRGATIIRAPLATVVSVLLDLQRFPEWIPDLREARLIRQVSPTERLEWWQMKMPYGLDDREFQLRTRLEREPGSGRFLFHLGSVASPDFPTPVKTVGQIRDSGYVVSAATAASTHVEFFIHVDPKGFALTSFVNQFQIDNTRRNLEGIRGQVMKAAPGDSPSIEGVPKPPPGEEGR